MSLVVEMVASNLELWVPVSGGRASGGFAGAADRRRRRPEADAGAGRTRNLRAVCGQPSMDLRSAPALAPLALALAAWLPACEGRGAAASPKLEGRAGCTTPSSLPLGIPPHLSPSRSFKVSIHDWTPQRTRTSTGQLRYQSSGSQGRRPGLDCGRRTGRRWSSSWRTAKEGFNGGDG